MKHKKIGIIGSGIVAQTLGSGFAKHGFEVMLGTRDTSKLIEWKSKEGQNVNIGSFEQAAKFGDMIVLAAKGTVAKEALKMAGAAHLRGKTIIDATNPIADSAPENGVLKFFTNLDKSLMEDLQEAFPEANFVKAFNSVGSPFMVNPPFKEKPTMFIAGNNDASKKEVTYLNELFGWETEDMGDAAGARAIEPLCMLWCIPGLRENRWNHAFRLIKV
ncbi:MAG: NAD(P)-binding domain-containing protein [Bacteroidota bacterium]|nr:MAG: NAD(P)-binding domain-containing protein [Bacteroidota bacterium]